MKKQIGLIILFSLLSTALVWFPFFSGLKSFSGIKIPPGGMQTVFANYDGPNYLVIAKTLYKRSLISTSFSLPLLLEYYPAHFPGYPLTIKILDFFISGPWAMLISTLFFTILSAVIFYLLLQKFKLSTDPVWLSLLFLFFPARWLVVRTVGSPEPLFIFAILASFYYFRKNRLLLAGIFGAIAQLTKSAGILLFVAYGGYLIYQTMVLKREGGGWSKLIKSLIPLLLIPLSLLGVFLFYQLRTGDFFAYFHSGDNFHLVFPPFQSFVTGRNWLGDFWLEDMIYVYLLGALTVVLLIKQKLYDLASFALVFFSATLFVAHRDLSRYSLPLMPFTLIALSPVLVKKEFKIAFLIILIPIYLYTINFIIHNTAPVADWTPYL